MEETMTEYQERQAAFNRLARVAMSPNARCLACEHFIAACVPEDGRCGECYVANRKTALEYDAAVPREQKVGAPLQVRPCLGCGTRAHAGLDASGRCTTCATVSRNLAERDEEDAPPPNGARVSSSFGVSPSGGVEELASKQPQAAKADCPACRGAKTVAVLARAASAQALRLLVQALSPTTDRGDALRSPQMSESMLKTLIEVAERADVLADRVIAGSEVLS
jgi:hypothetical protein